jgi:hypothetical protein
VAHPFKLQVGRHSRQQANQRTKSSGPVSSMSMQAEYRRSDERHGWVRAVESLEQLDRVHDTTLASPSWSTKSFVLAIGPRKPYTDCEIPCTETASVGLEMGILSWYPLTAPCSRSPGGKPS